MKSVTFESSKLKNEIDLGNVVSFPTETVYGFGIRWDDSQAFLKLASVKQRAINKPVSIMCGTKFPLKEYFEINHKIQKIIDRYLPGPLTILLKAKANVPWQTHLGTNVVGIRIPKFDKLLTLLDDLNYPLQVTSANLSNQSPLTTYEDVLATFSNQPLVTCIVEGQCVSSIPTTIISLVDGIKLIRQGELPFDKLVKDFQQS